MARRLWEPVLLLLAGLAFVASHVLLTQASAVHRLSADQLRASLDQALALHFATAGLVGLAFLPRLVRRRQTSAHA